MKFSTIAAIVTATVGVVASQPHKHQHQHVHKRTPEDVVTVYEYQGHLISAADVAEGIKNGTLIFEAASGEVAPVVSAATEDLKVKPKKKKAHKAASKVSSAVSSAVSSVAAVMTSAAPSSKVPAVSIKSVAHPKTTSTLEIEAAKPSVAVSAPGSSSGSGADFPDGELSCSTFPSSYGAVSVPWMGLGGWSGIQSPGSSSGGFNDIMTKISGESCSEGDFCSYACEPGYQKSQWPEMQGLTGQSVGGILCSGGKLHLTNKAYSTLCIKGAEQVLVQVKNTLGQVASICRTDYPGSENEVIPMSAEPGMTLPLTTPDGSSYYSWQGKPTSAQYYVNPAGVPVSTACQWGNAGDNFGNFAPLNIGAGYSDGAAWLSIFQNLPTTDAKLDYTIELVGDGDNMVGKCRYKNGQYCSGDNYETCSSTTGCTVNVKSGTATFVLS